MLLDGACSIVPYRVDQANSTNIFFSTMETCGEWVERASACDARRWSPSHRRKDSRPRKSNRTYLRLRRDAWRSIVPCHDNQESCHNRRWSRNPSRCRKVSYSSSLYAAEANIWRWFLSLVFSCRC